MLSVPLALLLLVAAGCAAGPAATAVPAVPAAAATADSGFLTDYSRLVASDQSPAVRFYRDESRKGGYQRLYVRPVSVWQAVGGAGAATSEDDLQFLADAFYQALDRKLGRNFEMVHAAGPGVLEIDIGFTLVPDPEAGIDHLTTVVPVPKLAPRKGELPEATRRFVQDCLLEIEFRDVPAAAATAEAGKPAKKPKKTVRAAFVDARRGADSPKGNVRTWDELDAVFEKWAAALDERLVALRDGNFQPKLTAGGAAKKK